MTQNYTILFDLDGTVVDTAPDLMAAHNHVMKKFGHEQKELYKFESFFKSIKKKYFVTYFSYIINVKKF